MKDLSTKQVNTNLKTYHNCARQYSDNVEWNYLVSHKVEVNILRPFLSEVSERSVSKRPKVLFMGCGTGRNIHITKQTTNFLCYGVDISKNMIEIARQKVGKEVKLSVEDIREYTAPNCSFDGVFAESVLSYIPRIEMEKSVKKLYKILKPGGVLLLGFKVNGEVVHRDTLLGENRYYLTYKTEYLYDLVTAQGFTVINYRKSTDPLRDGVYWCDFFLVK